MEASKKASATKFKWHNLSNANLSDYPRKNRRVSLATQGSVICDDFCHKWHARNGFVRHFGVQYLKRLHEILRPVFRLAWSAIRSVLGLEIDFILRKHVVARILWESGAQKTEDWQCQWFCLRAHAAEQDIDQV
jgi:hypothetical protein